MAKRETKPIIDPMDIEVHQTVGLFEVAFRKAEPDADGKKYFEIVLRSLDRTHSQQLLLTDDRRLAASRLMAFHAGACAMEHLHGVPLRRAA